MSLLDKFKKKFEKRQSKAAPEENKPVKAKVDKSDDKGKDKIETKIEIKDKSGLASQVILRPLQTEKITDQMVWGQYTFEVAINTNKSEIKKAIRAIYEVEPIRVHVVNVRGKAVRFGRTWSKRKNWKKAIVTLKPGDKIEVYEGV